MACRRASSPRRALRPRLSFVLKPVPGLLFRSFEVILGLSVMLISLMYVGCDVIIDVTVKHQVDSESGQVKHC